MELSNQMVKEAIQQLQPVTVIDLQRKLRSGYMQTERAVKQLEKNGEVVHSEHGWSIKSVQESENLKIYDMRCPGCKEFPVFKNNKDSQPKCQSCGYVMTNKDTKAVLDAVWEENKKEQQNEKCISCNLEEGE